MRDSFESEIPSSIAAIHCFHVPERDKSAQAR